MCRGPGGRPEGAGANKITQHFDAEGAGMHSEFGGDGKDHAKGFVLASLYGAIAGLDLRVDPMFSDAPMPAGRSGLAAYCRFLRIQPTVLVNNELQYRGSRPVTRAGQAEPYFQPHFGRAYDLFLDPDTGFGKASRRHVPWEALPELISPQSTRILAVFQSRHRVTEFEHQFARRHLADYDHFWADLGQGAYIVFIGARANPRLTAFRRALDVAYCPYTRTRGPEPVTPGNVDP